MNMDVHSIINNDDSDDDYDASTQTLREEPVRRSFLRTLRNDANIKCLILTGAIYGCFGAVAWCRITSTFNETITKTNNDEKQESSLMSSSFQQASGSGTSPCGENYVYVLPAFGIMLYFLYLVECWHSKVRLQISAPKADAATIYRKIEQMKEAPPIIWWKAICYHYIRRTQEVVRARNEAVYTTYKTSLERVNSNAVSGCFFYALCGMQDVSNELVHLEKHMCTKVKLSKGLVFANLAASADFQEQRSRFFEEHEQCDQYMEMREGMELLNVHFHEKFVVWSQPHKVPWFATSPAFWLLSAILLSWPLRLWIEYKTAHIHFKIRKLLGSNYLTPDDIGIVHLCGHRNGRFSNVRPRAGSATGLVNPHITEPNTGNTPTLNAFRFNKGERAFQDSKLFKFMSHSFRPSTMSGNVRSLRRSVTLFFTQPKSLTLSPSKICVSQDANGLVPSYSQALLLMNDSYQNSHISNSTVQDVSVPSRATHVERINASDQENGETIVQVHGQPDTSFHEIDEMEDQQFEGQFVQSVRFPEMNGHTGLLPSSESFSSITALNTIAPRNVTGVTIDLTHVVTVTVPNDPRSPSGLPPSYEEALRTSRPVFVPAWAQIRRCITDRDIAQRYSNLRDSLHDVSLFRNHSPNTSAGSLQQSQTAFSAQNEPDRSLELHSVTRSNERRETRLSDIDTDQTDATVTVVLV